jgi:hypothetical protein
MLSLDMNVLLNDLNRVHDPPHAVFVKTAPNFTEGAKIVGSHCGCPDDTLPSICNGRTGNYGDSDSQKLRRLLRVLVMTYGRDLPPAVACLTDDFEACIAHLRFALVHRARDPHQRPAQTSPRPNHVCPLRTGLDPKGFRNDHVKLVRQAPKNS